MSLYPGVATVPPPDHPVPGVVATLAAGREIEPVWVNGIGGATWRLTAPGSTPGAATFLKVGPPHPEFDVSSDAERLEWVGRHVTAPRVVGVGHLDGLDWIETAAIPGHSAVSVHFGPTGEFAGRIPEVVSALGRALRAFHDAVPVGDCPWSWSVAERLDFRPQLAREQLGDHPPLDLVVCHGDACNPNFLFADDLTCTGYVDLGRVGVADRWADLAPAVLSLGWNFGPGHEQRFLDAYGIEPDPAKLGYYTDLWNAEDLPVSQRQPQPGRAPDLSPVGGAGVGQCAGAHQEAPEQGAPQPLE